MKKYIIILFAFCISVLISMLIIIFIGNHDNKHVQLYNDAELYKNNKYENLNNDNKYVSTVNKAKLYFPKYENFPYADNILNFYIYDGSQTISKTSISFVLELKFDNFKSFNEFLKYENNRLKYNTLLVKNNFLIKLCIEDKITFYRYQKEVPYSFGLLCENAENLIVRYVYFSEREIEIDEDYEIVFLNTNCEW